MSGFDEVYDPNGNLLSRTPSASQRVLTPEAFLQRFTAGEIATIERSKNETVIALRVRLFVRVDPVHLDAPDIRQAMSLFQALGILTAERSAEIVA